MAMKPDEYLTYWKYYQSVERSYAATEQFVAHRKQNEHTISNEFAKLIMIIGSEIDVVFKALCCVLGDVNAGDIGKYKSCVLSAYQDLPRIKVKAPTIESLPFDGWDKGPLTWWDACQHIKHDRHRSFAEATWITTHEAMAAYYLLIILLRQHLGDATEVQNLYLLHYCKSEYFYSISGIPPTAGESPRQC